MLNLRPKVYVQMWQPIFKEVETLVACRPWLQVSDGLQPDVVNLKNIIGGQLNET